MLYKQCFLVVMLLAVPLIAGCAGVTTHYYVSAPVISSQSNITKKGVIDFAGISIIVRPAYRIRIGYDNIEFDKSKYETQARRYSSGDVAGQKPDHLYIEFFINPGANKAVAFDPQNIVLTTMKGERLRPSKLIGPISVKSKRNYALPLCDAGSDIITNWQPNVPLVENSNYCFALKFHIPLLENMEFLLDIGGVSRFGEKIYIHSIDYKSIVIENYES